MHAPVVPRRAAWRPLPPVLAAAAAVAVAARALGAQAVRVEVRDSITGDPVRAALVSLDAADGGAVATAVTGPTGVGVVGAAPGAYRLRVRRIGHRPYVGPPVTLAAGDTVGVVARVPRTPVALPALHVRATPVCRTAGSPAMVALWDAARTALSAALGTPDGEWAGGGVSGAAVLVEQRLDPAGRLLDAAEAPLAAGGRPPFAGVDPAALAREGYIVGDLRRGAEFRAPDVRALLSDDFAWTHCFAPARGAGPTAGWVGVRFTPAPKRAVPDIAGVIWLDSATAEPRRVEFAYQSRAIPRAARGLGGTTDFARLPTGEVVVRAWRIRLPRLTDVGGTLRLDGYRVYGGDLRLAASGAPP